MVGFRRSGQHIAITDVIVFVYLLCHKPIKSFAPPPPVRAR